MLKKAIAKIFASFVVRQIESTYSKAAKIQKQTLVKLIKKGAKTQFGIEPVSYTHLPLPTILLV